MFLDDEFYTICKKPSTCIEDDIRIAQELHKAIVNHIKIQVLDKLTRSDTELLIVCKRIDKQFQNTVQRLKTEGIDYINPNFIQSYFKKLYPEIAEHLYKN